MRAFTFTSADCSTEAGDMTAASMPASVVTMVVCSCCAVSAPSSCAHEPRRKALFKHSPSHVHAQCAVRATREGKHKQRANIFIDLGGASAGSND